MAGQVMVGAVLSVTVTVKEHVAELPAPSVTRKVFVVKPTGKEAPLGNPASCVVVGVQLSVPAGVVYVTTALQLGPAEAVKLDGQVMVGTMLSTTVTTAEQVEVFKAASVTESVTLTVPTFAQLKLD